MYTFPLVKSDQFILTSYGRGVAYELLSIERQQYVFVQGSDAAAFRDYWEQLEAINPQASTNCIMSRLWFDYEPIAQDVEEREHA